MLTRLNGLFLPPLKNGGLASRHRLHSPPPNFLFLVSFIHYLTEARLKGIIPSGNKS